MNKTCFISIDVERDNFGNQDTFEGVEDLDNILDIFKKHKVKATLFVTGQVLELYTDFVKKWAKDYEIGCHNYFHIPLDEVDLLEREKQLKKFVGLYQTIFKKSPKGFRAPRNIIDNKQFEILERYNFAYDSSVIPRHIALHRYKGYKGRAPVRPYQPSIRNYRKKGKKEKMNLIEIPNTPLLGGIPFAATWIRRLGAGFFDFLFFLRKPKFLSLTMHSWDGVKFKGRSSRNSGKVFSGQLDELLGLLKKLSYEFKSGEQIYEQFPKNRK